MNTLTHDTFFNGLISVKQPATGSRFSIDAVILGNLANVESGGRVLDLGTGCGVIPLILCWRHPHLGTVYGIEIQEELARIAADNMEDNRMSGRVAILRRDIKALGPSDTGGQVETVVCNPPHFAVKSGRINPDSSKAIARHEISMTLSDLTSTAFRMLLPGGRLIVIYPSERLADLLAEMRGAGIVPEKLRMIHPVPNAPARRVLAQGIKGKHPELKVEPPLYIRRDPADYSEEVSAMFRP